METKAMDQLSPEEQRELQQALDDDMLASVGEKTAGVDGDLGGGRVLPRSPALERLGPSRQPKPETVCEYCPHAVWFASPTSLQCYCAVMHTIMWSNRSPRNLTECDGRLPERQE